MRNIILKGCQYTKRDKIFYACSDDFIRRRIFSAYKYSLYS